MPSSIPKKGLDLTVVIVSWNVLSFLRACLDTLNKESEDLSLQVIVVDNGSTDGTVDAVPEEFPWVEFISVNENLGFAKANNLGLKRSGGKYALLLNPDTEIHTGTLRGMVDYMDSHQDIGAAGCQLLNSDESVQHSCRQFPGITDATLIALGIRRLFPGLKIFRKYLMTDWDHSYEMDVEQLMGAFIMVRREVLESVGLLDERFWMYYEEVDWCKRIGDAGWRIRYVPDYKVTHHLSKSARLHLPPQHQTMALQSAGKYFRKHGRFPGSWIVTGAVAIGIAIRWVAWWVLWPVRSVLKSKISLQTQSTEDFD